MINLCETVSLSKPWFIITLHHLSKTVQHKLWCWCLQYFPGKQSFSRAVRLLESDASAISWDLLLKQTQTLLSTWQAPQPVSLLCPGTMTPLILCYLHGSHLCQELIHSHFPKHTDHHQNMTIDIQPSQKACSNESRWKQPVNSELLQKQKLIERWFDGLLGFFFLKLLHCDQLPSKTIKTHLLYAVFFRNTCSCLHRQHHKWKVSLFGFM